jgi:hypothetical protein
MPEESAAPAEAPAAASAAPDATTAAEEPVPAAAPGAVQGDDNPSPQPAAKVAEAPAEEAPKENQALLDKAARLGLDPKLVAAMGEQAEEFLGRYESEKRSELEALGEKLLAEKEAAAKAPAAAEPPKTAAKEGEKPATPEPGAEWDPGEEYDEVLRGVHKKTGHEIGRLQNAVGYVLHQMEQLEGLRQTLWAQSHQNFLKGQGDQWKDTVADRQFQEAHARKTQALALAYQHEQRPFTEEQLWQESFDLLTAPKAKEAAMQSVVDAVSKNQKRISTPPNRRQSAPREPATLEEAQARERADIEEAMIAAGLATRDGLSPFSIK